MAKIKRKRAFKKYILRSIKDDMSRLFAIFAIVLLGMSFLVGLLSATPDLQVSVDQYYKDTNFTQLNIQSSIGFSDEDVTYIHNNVSGIRKIEGHYQEDVFYQYSGTRINVRHSYRSFDDDSINKVELVDGVYPANRNECLALEPNSNMIHIKIGDEVSYDGIVSKVVGIVKEPTYIANHAEQTIIGNGYLDAILYFDEGYFEEDNLTTTIIQITFDEGFDYNSFEDEEYGVLITNKIDDIKVLARDCINRRIAELKEEFLNDPTIREEAEEQMYDTIVELIKNSYDGMPDSIIETLVNLLIQSEMFQSLLDEQLSAGFDEQIEAMNPRWYYLDRSMIQSAEVFKMDSSKVAKISTIFPVFFFAVSLFVAVSSMTRIVGKDRQQMGTLKSLGYTKGKILGKYVLYGSVAVLLGCIIGTVLGTFILPYVIALVYGSLYTIPSLIFTFQWVWVLVFSLIMITLILASAIIIALVTLKEKTANLLTGKATQPGKKIWLERIPFVWKKMSFKYKSMFRNVFRFKKNLIMMVLGIGGCTGLLLASFGITDSINTMSKDQFNDIFKYNLIAKVNDIEDSPFKVSEGGDPVYYYEGAVISKKDIGVSIIATNSLGDYVQFSKGINFNSNSVIITTQIADYLDVSVGETIPFAMNDRDTRYSLQVSGITENYVNNYIYMGDKAFGKYFENLGQNAYINYIDFKDDEARDTYIRELSSNENVSAVISIDQLSRTYENVISNLSSIVLLLVVLSLGLAAIVIFNLTDINISERIKELATLRVLGYQRGEVLMYIFREIFLMAILGIVVGLGIGVLLHRYVVVGIGDIGLMFGMTISPLSFLYTILITMAFTIIITLFFRPKITKIKMAEALKSVD